jgi:hypothetical protein
MWSKDKLNEDKEFKKTAESKFGDITYHLYTANLKDLMIDALTWAERGEKIKSLPEGREIGCEKSDALIYVLKKQGECEIAIFHDCKTIDAGIGDLPGFGEVRLTETVENYKELLKKLGLQVS